MRASGTETSVHHLSPASFISDNNATNHESSPDDHSSFLTSLPDKSAVGMLAGVLEKVVQHGALMFDRCGHRRLFDPEEPLMHYCRLSL